MSDAPERIWADPAPSGRNVWSWGFWLAMPRKNGTEVEYIRANTADALESGVQRLTQERDLWIADAERYHQNADYWRIQCERLAQERDQIIERCAELCEAEADAGWDSSYGCATACAAAIRALKETKE